LAIKNPLHQGFQAGGEEQGGSVTDDKFTSGTKGD